jgi:hypothetical protein
MARLPISERLLLEQEQNKDDVKKNIFIEPTSKYSFKRKFIEKLVLFYFSLSTTVENHKTLKKTYLLNDPS